MTEHDLPEAELDVMGCLWTGGPATAREIREAMQDRRPLTHASVCTLLRRLEEKGFVTREKSGVGKAFRYSAKVAATGTARRLLDGLLDRVFGGNGVALVASLFESRPPSSEELDSLHELVEELEKNRQPRPKRRRK